MKQRLLLGLVIFNTIIPMVWARTAIPQTRPARIYDFQWYQKNQWRLAVTNYGVFGNGIGRSGGEWPAGSGDMYIYGAGVWIGCIKKNPAGPDTFVSNGYNPNSGKSEMTPGCYDNAGGGYGTRSYERIYITPDFPPNPADFPSALQDSVLTPLRIPKGNETIPSYLYYIPRTAISSGDGWAVFNDADPSNHTAGRTPRPIGIEVYQSIYSWNLPWNRDIVFFKYDIRNRSNDTLKDLYLGIACDADVGNAADDWCGLCLHKYIKNASGTDSVFADNLGYVYSDDASPSGFVGFDFLQSPFVKNPDGSVDGFDGIDNNGNGLIDEPAEGKQVGMSSFQIFILAGDPKNDFEQYLGLAGYDWNDPTYPYVPYDSNDAAPDDKRFLQATGPVTLAPNELTTVTVAVIAAKSDRSGSPSTWPYYLAVASRAAQQAYDNNWIMPEPPPGPNVTAIPGDGRVTLVWDDISESARDRFFPLAPALQNPYYVEQDFQGYKVYRSRSGQPGDWQLLAQFDKKDGIKFEDTTVVESLRTRATDNGLVYCFVDSANLRLGFPYYYAVTAYDINYLGGDPNQTPPVPPDTLTLESGIIGVRAVPRTSPSGYVPPSSDWRQVSGNRRLHIGIEPMGIVHYAVKPDTFWLKFLPPIYDPALRQPRYRYFVVNSTGETLQPVTELPVKLDSRSETLKTVVTIFDSVITKIGTKESYIETTYSWMPALQITIKLHMDSIPYQFFDRVRITGSYPVDSIAFLDDGTNNRAFWAYRGSHYRIVWKNKGAGRTVEVYDVDNEVEVPYRYMRFRRDPDSADGWCFQTVNSAADTVVLGQTLYLSLCGGQIMFRPRSGSPILQLPDDGDTWYVYSKPLSPAPYNTLIQITFAPGEIRTDGELLKVKVVPNPYLVRNEWERHRDFRKLKFINLPPHCNIYIYNLAGDLVKVIRHDDTRSDLGSVPSQYGGDEDWDLLNEAHQKPAPGTYIFLVESDDGRSQTGKFVVIY
ncbi:MAG: hypothetical protein ABIK48_03650 [candidate division WOR-3 bacterium]